MKSSFLFSDALTEALTYTLLHSVWQGLLVLLVLKSILLAIPPRQSTQRYIAAALSLALMLVGSVSTFFLVYEPINYAVVGEITLFGQASLSSAEKVSSIFQITEIISRYKESILIAWFAGSLFYTIRLIAGYWYLKGIKRKSVILNNAWATRVKEISQKIGIKGSVILAESTRVYCPIVVGFVKPFIILPAGLVTGLSPEQLEAVLLHELVHIKRHDFIINLFQSLLETLFFFNPFVWIISSMLRTEREHCCDDAVLVNGANATAYVRALAALEESRQTASLALSLIGNKNQLLERIKRLMEKSVKNHSVKEKLVPVLFLFVGLMCASWFSIQKGTDQTKGLSDDKVVAADTSIRKKQKSATFTRKKTTVVAPDGVPQEEIVEEFEGDEELRPSMDDFGFENHAPVPPIPDFEMPDFAPLADFGFAFDTIPPLAPRFGEWTMFEKEFMEKFQQKFGEFYQENQGEFQKMMEELQHELNGNDELLSELRARAQSRHDEIEHHALALADHENNMREHESKMRKFEEDMHKWENENHERMKELEQNLQKMEERMKKFEKALKEELVRDGYINSSDQIRNMHWTDDNEIEINGRQIKDIHLNKYRALHEKYFGKK